MKRVFAVCLLLSLSAGAAQAQLATFPGWYSPAFGSGVGIFANFGTGLNDDAKFDTSSPLAFGGHVLVSASAFKAWAGANYLDTKVTGADKEVTFGGNLGVALYQGAETPIYIDLMVGLGIAKIGTVSQTTVPIALPIAYGAELQNGALVEVWIAPRAYFFSTKPEGVESSSDWGWGGGAGINFYSQLGLGAFVNFQWLTVTPEGAPSATQPLNLGAGLSWRFGVPSFPEGKGLFGQN